MKTVIQIVLALAIVGLAYLVWDSIMQPIRFQKVKDWRYDLVKHRLMDIRDAQVAYKSINHRYTNNFDTLEDFVRNGKLKIVKETGNIPDSFFNKYTRKEAEKKAIEAGIVRRDTIVINCADTLCKGKYIIDSMRYVPQTGGKLFMMDTASYETASHLLVPLFECKTPNNDYLIGLDRQQVINLNDEAEKNEKYPGLKVGSVTEINNNAGNWE